MQKKNIYINHFFTQLKCFQLLLCITNNLIKHQSFVYTWFNDQTLVFQTILFNMSTQFKCQRILFDPKLGPYHVLRLRARVNLGAMVMKGSTTLVAFIYPVYLSAYFFIIYFNMLYLYYITYYIQYICK